MKLRRNDNGVVYYGKVRTGKRVCIWPPATIGFPLYDSDKIAKVAKVTIIDDGTEIMPFTMICQGARIGADVGIDEYSRIGCNTRIGDGSRIVYGASIHDNVVIGKKSIVGGFCCDCSRVGNRTTMFGDLVHEYPRHAINDWDNMQYPCKPSPQIGDDVIIGFNAIVIGDVKVASRAYVGAGAIVTKNVPKNTKIVRRYETASSPIR